ncbi:MAG: histidine--tRNA ligase [Ilumatobacteraceae bacterium]
MPQFTTSPGMRDILPPESARWRYFVDCFAAAAGGAGYGQVIPPLLEDIGVFTRLGEATDVVTKEMYDFTDKGGRHIALRPEQTASVCRAFVEHRPTLPFKAWYAGSNFRYEKPQRGRYRQFDQVGVEALGSNDPHLDVEVISIAWDFFADLGLQKVTLVVNSLGDPDDRDRYTRAVADYFNANSDELSEESRATLSRNPLRLLDSKRPAEAEIVAGAPSIVEFWSPEALSHFDSVRAGLESLGIPFVVDERLVRGLDYYRRTTFEFRGGTLDSAQNALGGGGRYDGLIEDLGGPATPGVGFALGVDRTLLACDDEGVFVAPDVGAQLFIIDTTGGEHALLLSTVLRRAGYRVDRAFDRRSMKAQMKAADRSGAALALIIGDEEAASDQITLRPMYAGGNQTVIPTSDLLATVSNLINTVETPNPGEQ